MRARLLHFVQTFQPKAACRNQSLRLVQPLSPLTVAWA